MLNQSLICLQRGAGKRRDTKVPDPTAPLLCRRTNVKRFRKYASKADKPDNQRVRRPKERAKESGSFMAGKSEFHGRKVGERAMVFRKRWYEINVCKIFS